MLDAQIWVQHLEGKPEVHGLVVAIDAHQGVAAVAWSGGEIALHQLVNLHVYRIDAPSTAYGSDTLMSSDPLAASQPRLEVVD